MNEIRMITHILFKSLELFEKVQGEADNLASAICGKEKHSPSLLRKIFRHLEYRDKPTHKRCPCGVVAGCQNQRGCRPDPTSIVSSLQPDRSRSDERVQLFGRRGLSSRCPYLVLMAQTGGSLNNQLKRALGDAACPSATASGRWAFQKSYPCRLGDATEHAMAFPS